jgi:hypothetical protein
MKVVVYLLGNKGLMCTYLVSLVLQMAANLEVLVRQTLSCVCSQIFGQLARGA